MMTTIRKVHRELFRFETLTERYRYLALGGTVGRATFGAERYLNQRFYTSREWRRVRDVVIARDNGCDLGVEGHEIHSRLYIHHLNPLTVEEVRAGDDSLLDPENLITTTHLTHNAIHYGDERLLPQPLVERRPGDTKLW
jgi:hypothetical protein